MSAGQSSNPSPHQNLILRALGGVGFITRSVIIDPVLDLQTRNASKIRLVIGDQRDLQ